MKYKDDCVLVVFLNVLNVQFLYMFSLFFKKNLDLYCVLNLNYGLVLVLIEVQFFDFNLIFQI